MRPFLVTTHPNGMAQPVGLATVQSTYGARYRRVMVSPVIAGLPLLAVFAFLRRQIVRGVAHTGPAGQ